jgi:hypothetical protein
MRPDAVEIQDILRVHPLPVEDALHQPPGLESFVKYLSAQRIKLGGYVVTVPGNAPQGFAEQRLAVGVSAGRV